MGSSVSSSLPVVGGGITSIASVYKEIVDHKLFANVKYLDKVVARS
jgi:hypothetical protein